MPAKNSIKIYVENGYYHIYNRGVEKRTIFVDDQDYRVFLSYLEEYLSPQPDPSKFKVDFSIRGKQFIGLDYIVKNYFEKIDLIAYCLMPNHFHLLIKQVDNRSLETFMRSLATRYSMYFNKKYDRVGSLFQGPYKSAIVTNENYLLHLSRYIHLNPKEYFDNLTDAYSSYAEYLNVRKTGWIKPKIVLDSFGQASKDFKLTNTYKNFVEKYDGDESVLEDLTLED